MAGAIHPIHDTDNHFIIDPITRAIKNETVKKISLVIDDHNSEIFTFELPRHIEGHDMVKCNKVEVHYVNTHSTTKERSADRYKVADFGPDPSDPNKVIFSWIISKKATKFAGPLAFAVHFSCMEEMSEEVYYWWSTATNTTITVLDSINLTPEETEEQTDLQEKTATPTKDTQVVRPDREFRGLSRVVVEPIPDEFIIPTGTLFVEANGDYSVKEFDKIMVHVPDVPAVLQEKEITMNGTHTPDTGFEGFSRVHVNVGDAPVVLQEKTVYPSTSEQTVEPDRDFGGLSKVTVGPMKLQNKTIEQNGEAVADSGYHGLNKVTVRVEPKLQNKTVKQNGEVVADSGYDGLQKVSVQVPSDKKPEEVGTVEDLDFSAGDAYELNPSVGGVFSNVVILKPAALKPEYIKKGVTIAGVTGTFEGYDLTTYMYIGGSTKTSITANDVEDFGYAFKPITTAQTCQFETTSPGYIYIVIPSNRVLTSVTMDGLDVTIGTDIIQSESIVIGAQSYNVYRTSGRQVADKYAYIITLN